MASTIKLKNGSGAPTAGDLVQGEPALDLTNKRLYTEDAGGNVIEIGTSPSTIDINAGTIDGTVIGGASAAAGTFTTLTATGNVVLGNAATDTVTVTADVASDLIPSADGTYDLGASGSEWQDLFIDGTANIDSLVADTADINGGTIDGVTIGGASAAAGTFTTVTGTSFVSSGDMTFGDNDKAIFGAGSDLEIYHDGSNSFIVDNGTGVLAIRGSTQVALQGTNGENAVVVNENGEVDLRYDNVSKLATTNTGINVTGTVTADGLTVDGIVDLNPGTLTSNTAGTNQHITVDYNGTPRYGFRYDSGVQLCLDRNNSGWSEVLKVNLDTGDISFYEDTGTTPKLFWDASAEALGIGTTSPACQLDVTGLSAEIRVNSSADNGGRIAWDNSSGVFKVGSFGAANYNIVFDQNGSERARIDTSGRLLVGATSAGSVLTNTIELSGAGTSASQPAYQVYSYPGTSATNTGYFEFYRSRGASVATNTIVASGDRLGMVRFNGANGTTYNPAAEIYGEVDGTPGATNDMPGRIVFATTADGAGSTTERMRIDSSGNLLVGKTDPNLTINGVTLAPANSTSGFYASNTNCLSIGRGLSDGTAVAFNRSGIAVGSISVTTTATAYNTSSDYRLKENIVDAFSASDVIDAIQVRAFDWKADGSHQRYGMVAQELLEVAPEAVSGDPNSDDMMGVDYSKLVPMLVKEIQELRARVHALESE